MTIQDRIRMIEAGYNADRDLCGSDCPRVRYSEYSLLQIAKEQQERIEKLERQVQALINRNRNYEFERF